MHKIILLGIFINLSLLLKAQDSGFEISIDSIHIEGLEAVQSFAVGQHDGKWLIAGGRTDGLHQRLPFGAFEAENQNMLLIVIDPENAKKWTTTLASLPISIQEQLSSTNQQFLQQGKFLYVIGGYGYSPTAEDHVTFDKLTAIDVPAVINAIIQGSDFDAAFRQLSDPAFAVTGGDLDKIYDTWYLVGGQKFEGRYNPIGPDHGPGFIQEYTNQVRKFNLTDDGKTITIQHLPAITDSLNLHRRDYNVTAQIMPDRQQGLTAFSGVFQTIADIPYMNCVNIDSKGYRVNNDFSQYYNHYHCANIPLYDAKSNTMHTLFFGGIARYYQEMEELTQDNNVPFVKTIARVSRDKRGKMTEYKLPLEMPSFRGSGAEFIPLEKIPQHPNGVIKLEEINSEVTLLGYIYGGINSSAPNIFWENSGAESKAINTIYKVFLLKKKEKSHDLLNPQSTGQLKLQVFPNTTSGNMTLKFNLVVATKIKLTIADLNNNKILEDSYIEQATPGPQTLRYKIPELDKGGIYRVSLETAFEAASQRIVVEP